MAWIPPSVRFSAEARARDLTKLGQNEQKIQHEHDTCVTMGDGNMRQTAVPDNNGMESLSHGYRSIIKQKFDRAYSNPHH